MTVQAGLCRTWSEPKLLVFSCTGSNLFLSMTLSQMLFSEMLSFSVPIIYNVNAKSNVPNFNWKFKFDAYSFVVLYKNVDLYGYMPIKCKLQIHVFQ